MSLFPFVTTEDLTLTDQEVTASSIREYEIDFEKGTLTGRIVTGVDALCVWAYLALKAKRYRWIIYSWGYGDEVYDLIGYSYSEEYLDGLFQMGAVKLNLLFMVVSIVLGILLIKKKTTTMAYILAIIELIYVLLAITSGGSVGIGAISFLLSLVGAIRIDKKWKLYQEISVGNNQGNPAGNSTDGRTQNNAYAQYHTSQAANNETYWQKKPEENHGFVSTGASKSLKEALNIYKKEKSWSAENDMIESLKTSKVWVPYISEKNQMDILKNGERYYFPVFTSAAEMKEYGKKFYQREVYISDAINMAKESRYVLTGLVINAFTDSVILNWDQLGTVITDADDGEEKTMYKR